MAGSSGSMSSSSISASSAASGCFAFGWLFCRLLFFLVVVRIVEGGVKAVFGRQFGSNHMLVVTSDCLMRAGSSGSSFFRLLVWFAVSPAVTVGG
jgi:hypothetical protein